MSTDNQEQGNALDMSDDDFLNMDPSEFEGEIEEEEETAADDSDESEEEEASADDSSDDDEEDGEDLEEEEDDDSESDEEASDDENAEDDDSTDSSEGDSGESEDKSDDKEKPAPGELTTEQFADVGRAIMQEFKANGRMIKIKSADDAIQLMQMGANYHKKMAGLKPALKTLKLLEQNGLMEDKDLNYLIDLHQKKPEAIAKLLKDSNTDPMTVDVASGDDYNPSQRTVNEKEILIDEVLDSISESDKYQETLTVIGEEWDEASRAAFAESPELIRTINNHMEAGVFDQVAEAVAYERSLGKLTGVSDFEAYQFVGADMHEKGLFKGRAADSQNEEVANQNSQRESHDDSETIEQQQRRNRKKAVSPSRKRSSKGDGGKEKFNPLEISDEEFAKLNNMNF